MPGAALGGRCQDDLRAEHAHDLAALDREVSAITATNGIALRRANHRQRNAGIAGSRFDDRLAGLQCPGALRILDDGDREAVLHRAERIEELALHIHRDVLRREALNLHNGGAADRAENVVVDHGILCARLVAGGRRNGWTRASY